MSITLFNNKPLQKIIYDETNGILSFQTFDQNTRFQSSVFDVGGLATAQAEAAIGAAIPGNNTELIYNNSGAFGASSKLTFNTTNTIFTIGSSTAANDTITTLFRFGANTITAPSGGARIRDNILMGASHNFTANIAADIRNCAIVGGYNCDIHNYSIAGHIYASGIFSSSDSHITSGTSNGTSSNSVIIGSDTCYISADPSYGQGTLHSSIISSNTSYITGGGSYFRRGIVILGSLGSTIANPGANLTGSLIIGGEAITLSDASHTVAMPKVRVGLGTSGTLTGSSASDDVIVRNVTTGELEIRDEATITSDLRLKINIKPLSLGLDAVKAMNPVTYNWDKTKLPNKKDKINFGLIAQELEKIDPALVNSEAFDIEGDKYYGYKPEEIIPIIIKAIQELDAKVDTKQDKLVY